MQPRPMYHATGADEPAPCAIAPGSDVPAGAAADHDGFTGDEAALFRAEQPGGADKLRHPPLALDELEIVDEFIGDELRHVP